MTRQESPTSGSGSCTFEAEKARLQRGRRLLLLASSREDVVLVKSSAWKFFSSSDKFDGQRDCVRVEPIQLAPRTKVITDGGELITSTRSIEMPTTSICVAATTTRRRHRRLTGSGRIVSPWNLSLRQVVCVEGPKHLRSGRSAAERKRQRTRRRYRDDRGDLKEPEVGDRRRSTSVSFPNSGIRDVGEQLLVRSKHPRVRSTSFQHFTNIHRYIEQYRIERQVATNGTVGRARQTTPLDDGTDCIDQFGIERFSVELLRNPRNKHRRDSNSMLTDGSHRVPIADTGSRQPFSSLSFCDSTSMSSLTDEALRLPKIASKKAPTTRSPAVKRTVVGVNINLADFDKISPLSIRPLNSERCDVPYRYRLPEVDQLGDDDVKMMRRRRDVEVWRTDRRSRLSIEAGQRRSSTSSDCASVRVLNDGRHHARHSMSDVNASLFSAEELAAMLFLDLSSLSHSGHRADSVTLSARSSVISQQALMMLLNGASASKAAGHLSRASQIQRVVHSDRGRDESSLTSTPRMTFLSLATPLKPVAHGAVTKHY